MTSPAAVVRDRQKAWARSRTIEVDASGYVLALPDNLFVPLSAASTEEYRRADGDELGKPGKRGKMQALHSSSALACNVFEFWRARDTASLSAALGLEHPIVELEFERKFPIFSGPHAPNLDVVLTLDSGSILAIESKFMEPYAGRHSAGFGAKYFNAAATLWADHGLDACQALAEQIDTGTAVFHWLDAKQLLKHILGLASQDTAWDLLYLYYDMPGPAGLEHAEEIRVFARVTGADDIHFRAMSYQSLISAIAPIVREPEKAYLAYLQDRYFGDLSPLETALKTGQEQFSMSGEPAGFDVLEHLDAAE